MYAALVRILASRIAMAMLTLGFVSMAVFAGTEILPGDVAEAVLGQNATPEAVAGLRHALHLDYPAHIRYFLWLIGIFSGDAGRSLANNLPVTELIASRLPNSLMLASVTAVVSVPIALTLGISSAIWRGSFFDRAASFLTMSVVAMPEFLIATLAVIIFAVNLRWFPALSYAAGMVSINQFFNQFALPVFTLSCVLIALMMRMTRAAVIDTLRSPYIEMAVLKGARPIRLVLTHALPNAIGPIANAVALSLSYLLGGTVVVEIVFGYPGLARLLVDAVSNRDMPVVQACVMIVCSAYLFLVILADIAGVLSNPRLRYR
ncbi:ABC transporter permease subunit [Bradyrhizobium sp. CSA207]|uniref:ABC transporter permease n=1 Tax=Bradyrhizobium sp. CSA207 TaxID=2698826 RepID=UPI0023B01D35|nr:ABC transporter permease [Bradyrhizobium sp. CSA207]MDE5446770.1 ABC transporter permease subunit [Bradyrhizobium sp. CSA207]